MAVGKNITRKKENGMHLSFNFKAVGKNIKREKGIERKCWGRKSRFKIMGMGKNIKL